MTYITRFCYKTNFDILAHKKGICYLKTGDLNACFGVSVWLIVSIAGTPFGLMCSRLSTDLLLVSHLNQELKR